MRPKSSEIMVKMEIISTYYYRKGKVGIQTVAYCIASVLLVALGVFCITRWDLSFLFTDWKGYVMLGMNGSMLRVSLSPIPLLENPSPSLPLFPSNSPNK